MAKESKPLPATYESPRLSGEIADCSMPVSLDTYSVCGFTCLYCFSAYQRMAGPGRSNYESRRVQSVSVERIKRLFTDPPSNAMGSYIRARRMIQWGGLSDQFDPFERKYGVTLQLLRFFREIAYPISFSTKGVWWLEEPEYRECFKGAPWHLKISITTGDERKAAIIERGVPSPAARLRGIALARELIDHVTLRFRPFIIGISNPGHQALIKAAAEQGADSMSTEFLCLEGRATGPVKRGWRIMSKLAGFDIEAFYKTHSTRGGMKNTGYMRLNREVKRPFIDEMEAAAREAGIRFYVSDADFKERCAGGSCCGVPDDWSWSRGQITQALLIAKERGEVHWSDIRDGLDYTVGQRFRSNKINSGDVVQAAPWYSFTLYEFLRYHWNHPESFKSPYRYFDGVMRPDRVDENGDVVYVYDPSRI